MQSLDLHTVVLLRVLPWPLGGCVGSKKELEILTRSLLLAERSSGVGPSQGPDISIQDSDYRIARNFRGTYISWIGL